MFKDLYKSANDKIPTGDAYLRVMEKVNAKPEKSKYPYMKVAALAACFVLTVAMVSVYENNKHQAELPIEPTNVVTETIPEPVAIQEVVTPEPVKKPQTNPVSKKQESTKIVMNAGMPEEAGIAVARFMQEGSVVTSEMYKEYIGKDVEGAVLLPDGYENLSPEEQILVLEEGENFNDKWTYYFEGEESSVFITTSKNTEDVKSVLENPEYEKSNISGVCAVVFSEEMQKTAFFEAESIGYTVTGMNVSDGDFENILTSLVK